MKKYLLTTVALLGMATTTTAADLYVAPAPVPAPIDNFSGFYGGVHGGWGFGNASSAYADDAFNPGGQAG